MLALVLALALAQPAPTDPVPGKIAVVVSSHRPGAARYSRALADRVREALVREELPHVLSEEDSADASHCKGVTSCLENLAATLGPRAIAVGVDVGKLGSRLAVHLEAVSALDGSTLAVRDFTAPVAKWRDATVQPVTLFARALKEKLPVAPQQQQPQQQPQHPDDFAARTPGTADAPLKPDLLPQTKARPEPAMAVSTPASPSKSAVPWVLACGGAVAAGAAATFGVLGMNDLRSYEAAKYELHGEVGTHLSEPDARALATRTNTRFTLALSSAVVAVGLGAASTWMFSQD